MWKGLAAGAFGNVSLQTPKHYINISLHHYIIVSIHHCIIDIIVSLPVSNTIGGFSILNLSYSGI